ncbi:MAG: cupin domain-containing protein [Gemmatimonadetes bacterium]|nr:cupin domain-containing protein [Gemmatimonadota bacterium]
MGRSPGGPSLRPSESTSCSCVFGRKRGKVRKPHVLLFDEVPSVDRGSGVSTKPLVKEAIGATAFINGVTSFPSGASIPWHTHNHNVDESVTLLEGSGQFQSEGVVRQLKPCDTVFVPAGVAHRFVNTGSGVMRILWVYGGTKVTRTFTETGITLAHLSEEDKAAPQGG